MYYAFLQNKHFYLFNLSLKKSLLLKDSKKLNSTKIYKFSQGREMFVVFELSKILSKVKAYLIMLIMLIDLNEFLLCCKKGEKSFYSAVNSLPCKIERSLIKRRHSKPCKRFKCCFNLGTFKTLPGFI